MKHSWAPSKYGITLTRTVAAYDPGTGVRTYAGWKAFWHAPVAENSPLYNAISVWCVTRKGAYAKARKFALAWKRDVDRDVAAGVAEIEKELRRDAKANQ